ncbi:MAG TPA: hypothetical protein VLJ37_06535 [bacterium]|nr:hypothetical protein [bacterium]
MSSSIIVISSVCAAAARQQAETFMEQASRTSGAASILPLSVAAAAFRNLQDGVRASEAGSRLIKVRFSHALEQLFEELLGDFFSEAGPEESARYFRLVLSEAEDLGGKTVPDKDVNDMVRYARRFVDRAETGHWDHLARWSLALDAAASAFSPEARAGLHLFEAWLQWLRRDFDRAPRQIENALRALRTDRGEEPVAFHWEKAGRLHYNAGLTLTLSPTAPMGELQKAALHFHDAGACWDRAGSPSQPARKLLAQTYRRLAQQHTEGNPALRIHFEKQAFQALMDPEPLLPEARVVRRPRRSGYFSWLPRSWR